MGLFHIMNTLGCLHFLIILAGFDQFQRFGVFGSSLIDIFDEKLCLKKLRLGLLIAGMEKVDQECKF